MNIGIVAVGLHSGFTSGGSGAIEVIVIAGFALIGMVLVIVAVRICGRARVPAAADYTSPRR